MKLGDTVSGVYCGEKITGVITAYDGSGCVYVTLPAPITVFGLVRDGLCFDKHDRHVLKVIGYGPELAEGDTKYAGEAFMGLCFLVKK